MSGWPKNVAGGVPSGAAGGSLSGTYPNPGLAATVAIPTGATAITQAPGDNTTAIATDAFVTAAVAAIPVTTTVINAALATSLAQVIGTVPNIKAFAQFGGWLRISGITQTVTLYVNSYDESLSIVSSYMSAVSAAGVAQVLNAASLTVGSYWVPPITGRQASTTAGNNTNMVGSTLTAGDAHISAYMTVLESGT